LRRATIPVNLKTFGARKHRNRGSWRRGLLSREIGALWAQECRPRSPRLQNVGRKPLIWIKALRDRAPSPGQRQKADPWVDVRATRYAI
jgi:hypothetical protein